MADENETTTEEPQAGTEPESGSSDTGGAETGVKTWDEFIANLDEDQQKLVRSEIERRDRDIRKVRNEAKNLRERVQKAEPKAAEQQEAEQRRQTAEERAAELSNTLRADNEGLRTRLVTQEIRVLAAAKFADPDDPVGFLDASEYLDTDLEPDRQAISDALDDLLARKPHLAKAETKPRPPAPNPAQGAGPPVKRGGEGGLAEAERRFGKQKTSA